MNKRARIHFVGCDFHEAGDKSVVGDEGLGMMDAVQFQSFLIKLPSVKAMWFPTYCLPYPSGKMT